MVRYTHTRFNANIHSLWFLTSLLSHTLVHVCPHTVYTCTYTIVRISIHIELAYRDVLILLDLVLVNEARPSRQVNKRKERIGQNEHSESHDVRACRMVCVCVCVCAC